MARINQAKYALVVVLGASCVCVICCLTLSLVIPFVTNNTRPFMELGLAPGLSKAEVINRLDDTYSPAPAVAEDSRSSLATDVQESLEFVRGKHTLKLDFENQVLVSWTETGPSTVKTTAIGVGCCGDGGLSTLE